MYSMHVCEREFLTHEHSTISMATGGKVCLAMKQSS